jgi:hypothetical protein
VVRFAVWHGNEAQTLALLRRQEWEAPAQSTAKPANHDPEDTAAAPVEESRRRAISVFGKTWSQTLDSPVTTLLNKFWTGES